MKNLAVKLPTDKIMLTNLLSKYKKTPNISPRKAQNKSTKVIITPIYNKM